MCTASRTTPALSLITPGGAKLICCMLWPLIHSFPDPCPLRLAWIAYAPGERSRSAFRRPDRASMPPYPSGELAHPKCKPSYMDWFRTACTVPAGSWYTTAGSIGIGRAFYGAVGSPSRTTSIFAKCAMWGRHIAPRPPRAKKGDLGFLTDPYATETHSRLRIPSRFACSPSVFGKTEASTPLVSI